nr:PREDICTED: putative ferric-chelate reductase 1 [Lepisosteus oculatus]
MDQRLSVALLLLGLTVLVDGQTVAAPFTGNITRNGCGATKFCIETPTGCDPASGGNCLFASAARDTTSTTGISFNLQGNSSGYIAAILSTADNNSMGDAFVCAQNASDTLFYRALYSSNGSSLSPQILNNAVGNITGTTMNNVIKCAFIVRNLTRSRALAQYSISLAVGSLVNGQLGTATLRVQSNGTVNLLNTNSTNTTAPSGGNRPAFVAMHGLLVLVAGLLVGVQF